jgi:L-threonylcarbamoyladenylate synthase
VSQFLSNCTADAMLDAASHLNAGDLVAFPTETVYGLGADASNSKAVARIYSVKGRPNDHPLIVHIASMERMGDWASDVPEYAIALARSFWPGPMTLILKRSELAGDFITGGQDSVGVRVPDHVVALALLEAFERSGGKGIAAPSANRFGHVSPTTATAVIEELGDFLSKDDLVLDGGACAVGVESTIIDCTGRAPQVLRPGAVSVRMIEESTGLKVVENSLGTEIRTSGSLDSHYAPNANVILDATPKAGDGLIAMKGTETPINVQRLASPINHEEFAHVLYAALRLADQMKLVNVVVIQPQGDGIATAIRDRLKKAASG